MITIVDYGMGNLASIRNMIKKIGGRAEITSDLTAISQASSLILPGVGHFGKAMGLIRERGMEPVLNKKVLEEKVPILGICLGMQLLLDHSEEGDSKGLGWIEGEVKKFEFDNPNYKVPHMGWTAVNTHNNCPLFNGFENELRFYFVHSYYATCKLGENIIGTARYGFDFTCAVHKNNIYGTQFHPEKSHKYGMQLLKNYLEICGE